jgi:hypothetical protein
MIIRSDEILENLDDDFLMPDEEYSFDMPSFKLRKC